MAQGRVQGIVSWSDEVEANPPEETVPQQTEVRTPVASLDNIKKNLDRCLLLLTSLTSRITSMEEGQTEIGRRLAVMETAIARIQTITQSSGFERTRTRYD